MPQLDRLIALMVSHRASLMRLGAGELVRIVTGGAEVPVTRKPLSLEHLLTILSEVAPAGASKLGEVGGAFTHHADGADYQVTVSVQAGQMTVEVAQLANAAPDRATPDNAAPPRTAKVEVRANGAPDGAQEARGMLNALLKIQMEKNASDLHLRTGAAPLMRLHGEIAAVPGWDVLSKDRIDAMIYSIISERNRKEFDELSDSDFAYELPDGSRFRVNVFRDRHGPGAVMRAIPSEIITADKLGLSPEVQALCKLSKGLVLVTGPTGSGKSTTLSALVDLVNRTRTDHIITIEDPIEFVHESKGCLITQRQVGIHTSSFKHALRAALREDPDVVLVGELRDLETVGIAIETAETGHLVFATLHTSTAASTIDRVIDQFPSDRQDQIRVMLSESLKGVISQTLCRRIGGGRVAAMEILLATPALSNLIREAKTFQIPSVMQTSRKLGMVTLNDALLDLATNGVIEAREAYLKAIDKSSLATSLKARGIDISCIDGDVAAATSTPPGGRPDNSGVGVKTPQAKVGVGVRR
jgi:twitching motility protein PilT